MKISVIVPTYNRPEALILTLKSLSKQSRIPDEVIIADDGSTETTKDVIIAFKNSSECNFELKHIWQEDIGFRKPRIINETVRNCTGDYLIFIDGDCIAHKDFVKSHVENSAPNEILGGKRVDIGKTLTEKVLKSGKTLPLFTVRLLIDSVLNDTRKAEEAILVRNAKIRSIAGMDRISNDGIWGCNFSVYKTLFYKINGSDEDFLDGSIEDNDLGIRVLNSGGKLKSLRFKANVFHLWHESSWSFTSEKYLFNRNIMEQRIINMETACVNGIIRSPLK